MERQDLVKQKHVHIQKNTDFELPQDEDPFQVSSVTCQFEMIKKSGDVERLVV